MQGDHDIIILHDLQHLRIAPDPRLHFPAVHATVPRDIHEDRFALACRCSQSRLDRRIPLQSVRQVQVRVAGCVPGADRQGTVGVAVHHKVLGLNGREVSGKGFERGTVFLPQLLMSAEAAKAAFEVVKDAMSGTPREMKGKVILATVKGDIHDIGKNIVKVLLENYGYEVLDLGKDVPAETIVEKAIEEDVRLVGLSALMTTTVVSMEETIRRLRAEKPGTLVVVGGAVMTQEYADEIGADCYAKEAMDTVRYADRVFGS